MKVSVSTIKEGQIYCILYLPNPEAPQATRAVFEQAVIDWTHRTFDNVHSIFTAVERDLYSMVVILNINSNHQAPQQVVDI